MGFNEREAIRFRLEKIDEEKRRLEQRNWNLDKEYNFYIERLRELDRDGLGSPSKLTYEEKVEEKPVVETPEQTSQKKYSGDLKQYDFEALKKSLSNYKKKQPKQQEKPPIVDFGLNPNDRRRRGKQYNLKEVAEITERILKEHKEPMPIHKLRDRLADEGYQWKHFLPTLPNIMKHSEHIEKPYRGHVVYVENAKQNESEKSAIESEKSADETDAPELSDSNETALEETDIRIALDEIPNTAVSGAKK